MKSIFLPLLAQVGDAGQAPANSPLTPDEYRAKLLEYIFSLDLSKLSNNDWIYLAKYYSMSVALVLVLLTLAWTLSGWAAAAVRRAMTRVRFDATLTLFFAKLVRWLILLVAGLTCLSWFGVETTSFAAVIGAAGIAIGLALQGTLSNFAAGAMLLIFRPYKVGDVVNVAGYTAKVFEIELFTTALDTFDNRRIIVPNSQIYGAVIENITYHRARRADIDVGVSYDASIDETRRVLEKALRSVPQVESEPEPAVVLVGLGGSSVDWQVRGWIKGDVFLDGKQGLIRAVKMELDAAGISIPFPQLDIHLDPPGEAAA
ncbi:MAG: mechanosensitive ion channel family protein [Planctomycetales bacterium]|nr:mechanosensitive ion channel family protein [Planctomycetales bacterium]